MVYKHFNFNLSSVTLKRAKACVALKRKLLTSLGEPENWGSDETIEGKETVGVVVIIKRGVSKGESTDKNDEVDEGVDGDGDDGGDVDGSATLGTSDDSTNGGTSGNGGGGCVGSGDSNLSSSPYLTKMTENFRKFSPKPR